MIQVRYKLAEQDLTAAIIKQEYRNPSANKNFYDWMDNEIKERKGSISKATSDMHKSLLKSLRAFKPNVFFKEIDSKFLEDFEHYMRNKEKNGLNTQSKKFRALKAYLNRAMARDIIKTNPFSKYRIKRGKNKRVFLSEEELINIITHYKKELFPEKYKKVLKYFLAACFTGLRISDIKRFQWEWIHGDMIILKPKKLQNVNAEICEIPVTDSLCKLIGYKIGMERIGPVFDCYTDQVSSRYIKEVGKLLELKKDISFHTSRHTFATLFLERTCDLATLQKLLGHSNIQQTMIYAHTTDRKKKQQMILFNEPFANLF